MPALTRIDPEVNFGWGSASPGSPIRDTGWSARWTADLEILFSDTYTFSVNSEGGTRLWIDGKLVIDMWVSWVPTEYASLPMYLESGIHSLRLEYYHYSGGVQRLYWSTLTMPKQIIPAGPLQPPLRAGSPNPLNGAVDVKQTPILKWVAGDSAASHQVYFGTDEEAVRNADTSAPEYKGNQALGSESYDPGQLELDTTYYWRVDEVNDTNPGSPWTGALWSFKTANFPVIDDFEDYDVGNNEIWWSWKDGLGYAAHGNEPAYPGNGTGAAVGDESTASYTEETIVHRGSQAIPLFYDNSVLKYSEAQKTLTYPRDWTEKGVNRLTVWFIGDAANAAEILYVALNGNAIVTNDNLNAAQIEEWIEWNINLQAFADQGVNLANVNTIAIGLGNKRNPVAGGSGTMYFDDIRLYPPPEPAP